MYIWCECRRTLYMMPETEAGRATMNQYVHFGDMYLDHTRELHHSCMNPKTHTLNQYVMYKQTSFLVVLGELPLLFCTDKDIHTLKTIGDIYRPASTLSSVSSHYLYTDSETHTHTHTHTYISSNCCRRAPSELPQLVHRHSGAQSLSLSDTHINIYVIVTDQLRRPPW
jgi:hypothetical protein